MLAQTLIRPRATTPKTALDPELTDRVRWGRASIARLREIRSDRVRLELRLKCEAARLDRANRLAAHLGGRGIAIRLSRSRRARLAAALYEGELAAQAHEEVRQRLEQNDAAEAMVRSVVNDGLKALLELSAGRKRAT